MSFLKNIVNPQLSKPKTIFIVEDNIVYAKTLEAFLQLRFPNLREIKLFPVGETCLPELNKNPDVIIMDYFLDTKYYDADTGLEIIKKIRVQKPGMNIIILSAQKEIDVALEAVKTYNCNYVKKDEHAFKKVEEIINTI